MTTPKDREALLKSMARGGCHRSCMEMRCNGECDDLETWLADAEAILSAIEAAGCAVVPVRPTGDMCNAYWRRTDPDDEDVSTGLRRAIAASPFRKETP